MIRVLDRMSQRFDLEPQFALMPRNLASIKKASKLLSTNDKIKQGIQSAESDRIRLYVLAIEVRKLLVDLRAQFSEEESVGINDGARVPARLSLRAIKLWKQHASLLVSAEDILAQAEAGIKRTCTCGNVLKLVSQFWGFDIQLRKHQKEESQLIDDVMLWKNSLGVHRERANAKLGFSTTARTSRVPT